MSEQLLGRQDRYVLVRQLARGGYGTVFEAQPVGGGAAVAVKRASAADAVREARLLRGLGAHANIVRLLDVSHAPQGGFLVIELCGGSLAALVAARPPPLEAEIARLLRGAARGLVFIHARGVVHRDIKPSNLLVGADGACRLADFGLAQVREGGAGAWRDEADGAAGAPGAAGIVGAARSAKGGGGDDCDSQAGGTPYYMAPEAARGRVADSASDVWGLGASCFALVSGHSLLAGYNPLAALYRLAHDEAPPLESEPLPASASEELADFVAACLQRDPRLRPSAAQLLELPFLMRAAHGLNEDADSDTTAADERDRHIVVPRNATLRLVVRVTGAGDERSPLFPLSSPAEAGAGAAFAKDTPAAAQASAPAPPSPSPASERRHIVGGGGGGEGSNDLASFACSLSAAALMARLSAAREARAAATPSSWE